MSRPVPPPPPLADFNAGDGISWVRFVTGLVLVALSLTVGERGGEPPPPRAVAHPVPRQLVAGVELAPLQPAGAATAMGTPSGASGVSAATSAGAPEPGAAPVEPPRASERLEVRHAARAAVPRRARMKLVARRAARVVRHARLLTRAQVERDYLRHRDLASALTGEDSGSAYLMRLAARQRLRGVMRRGGSPRCGAERPSHPGVPPPVAVLGSGWQGSWPHG